MSVYKKGDYNVLSELSYTIDEINALIGRLEEVESLDSVYTKPVYRAKLEELRDVAIALNDTIENLTKEEL